MIYVVMKECFDCELDGGEYVPVFSTFDKTEAEKFEEDYYVTKFYPKSATVEHSTLDYEDAMIEIEKLKKQIELRDKEIRNRDNTIANDNDVILGLQKRLNKKVGLDENS